MKITSILFSFALAFQTIYSKAVKTNNKIASEQLNIPEEDNSYELVKNKKNNFIYKLHCPVGNDCLKIKNDLEFAFNTTSNAFGKYNIFNICIINY